MYSDAYLDVIGEVVGDMALPFLGTIPLTLHYGNQRVFNAREYRVGDLDTTPWVSIGGGPNELYTLIMINPDAPNPTEPCLKQAVLWIVTNIPGGTSSVRGTEVVPYEAYTPEIGIHRYVFALYKQQAQLDNIETPASRVCFNIRAFATENNLGNPVRVSNYFNVRKQTNKRKSGELND